MEDLKSGDPIRIYIAGSTHSYQTLVLVLRQHDGTGDAFDSDRYIIKDDGITKDIVYHDMVGANCAPDLETNNCFTEPDGVYYYTTKDLIDIGDGTFDSNSYHNVLKHQTNDSNISEKIRYKINNNPADFLDHGNQREIDIDGPYRNNELSRSAGCTIGKDGQLHQDEYMRILKAGVDNVENIIKIIHSYSNGDR